MLWRTWKTPPRRNPSPASKERPSITGGLSVFYFMLVEGDPERYFKQSVNIQPESWTLGLGENVNEEEDFR